jgi:hypothetical protein
MIAMRIGIILQWGKVIPQRKTLSDFSERVHQVGNDLLSRRCSIIGVQGLTAVFGMGTGGTPALYSPTVPSDAFPRQLA